MDIERELNQMIDTMRERTGQDPGQIVMHPDTMRSFAELHYMHFTDMDEMRGYVAQYNGTPIIASTSVEPDKIYLIQDQPAFAPVELTAQVEPEHVYRGPDTWWLRSPYGGQFEMVRSDPYAWMRDYTSFNFNQAEEPPREEEPDEIDESRFMEILNAGT